MKRTRNIRVSEEFADFLKGFRAEISRSKRKNITFIDACDIFFKKMRLDIIGFKREKRRKPFF